MLKGILSHSPFCFRFPQLVLILSSVTFYLNQGIKILLKYLKGLFECKEGEPPARRRILYERRNPKPLRRAELLEAWLAPTSVKYHDNLLILMLLNRRLALTTLRTSGPRSFAHRLVRWV